MWPAGTEEPEEGQGASHAVRGMGPDVYLRNESRSKCCCDVFYGSRLLPEHASRPSSRKRSLNTPTNAAGKSWRAQANRRTEVRITTSGSTAGSSSKERRNKRGVKVLAEGGGGGGGRGK